MIGIGVRY